jgi:hypothetical protein
MSQDEFAESMRPMPSARPGNYGEARGAEEFYDTERLRQGDFDAFFDSDAGQPWSVPQYRRKIEQWLHELPRPITPAHCLMAIADLQQLGKIGGPISAEEIAENNAARQEAQDAAETKKRQKLLDELMGARKWNPQIVGVSERVFNDSQEERRKLLSRSTTEELEQKVANLRWRRETDGKSNAELRQAANAGQLDATGHVSGSTQAPYGVPVKVSRHRVGDAPMQSHQSQQRESDIVLDKEFTAERLRTEPGLIRQLVYFPNSNNPRPGNVFGACNDRIFGRS